MNFRFFVVFILLLFTVTKVFSQFDIDVNVQSGASAQYSNDVEFTSDGGYIVTGSFVDSVSFAPLSVLGTPSIFGGNFDMFLVKYGSQGDPIWAVSGGGGGTDGANSVAISPYDDIYVTGVYSGSATFGSVVLPPFVGTPAFFQNNAFIVKYDSLGNAVWGVPHLCKSLATVLDVKTDQLGFVYALTQFSDTLHVDSLQFAPSNLGNEYLVTKYDSSGSLIWAKQIATNSSYGNFFFFQASKGLGGLAVDNHNNVYVTGNFTTSVQIDLFTATSFGAQDVFYAKLNGLTGSPIWLNKGGGVNSDVGTDIAIDQNQKVLICGHGEGNIAFGAQSLFGGGVNDWIIECDTSGNVNDAWLVNTNSSINTSMGISVDGFGNFLMASSFNDILSFQGLSLTPFGDLNPYAMRYNYEGDSLSFIWAPESAPNDLEVARATAASDLDNMLVVGNFNAVMDFGNNTAAGPNQEGFVMRLANCSRLKAEAYSFNGQVNFCQSESALLVADTNSLYSYQWLFNGASMPGEIFSNFTALSSGSYSVIVDSAGCKDTSNVLPISVYSLPNVSHSNLSAVCQTEVAFSLQGGSPLGGVYSGSAVISGSIFDPSLANLGTNLVTYTYTDGNSCSDSVTKTIVVNQNPTIFINNISACENGGSISLSGAGYGFPQNGTHIGPGVIGSVFDPSAAGVGTHIIYYSVAGCLADDSITAIVTAVPLVNITPIPKQCISTLFLPLAPYGSPFGGTFSGPGVSLNFFYPAIAGPGTHQIIYSVIASGCNGYDTFQLVVDPILNVSFSAFPNLCEGDASISLANYASPSGGVFSGTGITNDSIFDPVSVGTGSYTIQYLYSNTCGSDSALTVISVNGNPTISAVSSDVSCNGLNNGSAVASSSSGLPPYTYSWSNSANGPSIIGLSVGNYSVTVSDANGCSDSSSFSIAEPPALSAALSSTNVTCNAGNDGTAIVIVSGGVPAYSYLWSDGQTTAAVTGLSVGTYSVTITDANGCSIVETVLITEPTLFSTSVVSADVDCFGGNDGSASVSVLGGTPSYSFLWSNGSTNASISGLAVGSYSVTTTDGNGCSIIDALTISGPVSPLAASVSASFDVSCFGGSDGSAAASGSGGTAPYAFNWNNGSTNNSVNGLSAGNYSLTLSDANGCQTSQSITISEPASSVSASIVSSTNAICVGSNNGDASVSASGGTPGYSYAWSNGASTSSIIGLVIGTYEVTVTDINGCFDITQVDIIPATTAAVASISSFSNATCLSSNDGSAQVSVVGGTAPYTYAWSNLANTEAISGLSIGSYTVTVNSSNGCSDTTSISITNSDTIGPLIQSADTSIYLDASGSFTIDTAFINVASSDNCGIDTMYLSRYNFDCSDIGVPQPVMLYAVDVNGNIDSSANFVSVFDTISPNVVANNVQLFLDFSGLASITPASVDGGSFDACGIDSLYLNQIDFQCSDTGTNVVTLFAIDINGNIGQTDFTVSVFDTIAPVIITNNLTVFLDGTGNVSISVDSANAGTFDNCSVDSIWLSQESFYCSHIGTNTVTFNAIDISGNQSSTQINVTVLDTFSPTVYPFQLIALGLDANGTASLSSAQADSATVDCDLDSIWLSQTDFTCNEIGLNSVLLYAIDSSGNIDSSFFSVLIFDSLSQLEIVQDVEILCQGDSSGVISALSSGMNGLYEYFWNTGDTAAQITNLGPGSYFVTATSAAGCSVNDSISISEPEPYATLLSASSDSVCADDSSAFITALVEGNTAPYSFLWNNGSTNDSLIGIGAGVYFVSISDINGCQTFDSISITLLDCDTATIGIKESFAINELSVFPNPASDRLNVNFGNWKIDEGLKVNLLNSTGQFVKEFDQSQWFKIDQSEIQLDINDVAVGIYLLDIESDGRFITKRFVVGR